MSLLLSLETISHNSSLCPNTLTKCFPIILLICKQLILSIYVSHVSEFYCITFHICYHPSQNLNLLLFTSPTHNKQPRCTLLPRFRLPQVHSVRTLPGCIPDGLRLFLPRIPLRYPIRCRLLPRRWFYNIYS